MGERLKIPPDVIKELRAEVGFGCPICRSPFLTWHHFDPPYHVKPHNNPQGMIALCREHHDEADQNHYSIEELRQMKGQHRSSDDVKGSFPSWRKANILIRVGGSYFGGCRAVVSIMGMPIVEAAKNEVGMLSLSFVLNDENSKPLVQMVENAFEAYPENIHDLSVAARKGSVKLWLKERDIGLELYFSRITPKKLDEVLLKDFERVEVRTKDAIEKLKKDAMDHLPPFIKDMMQESEGKPPPWLKDVPEHIREQYLADDKVGYGIKKWVQRECTADDGLIPFLDFEQMKILHHGERITIKNGIGKAIDYCAAVNCDSGVNLSCPCSECSPPKPS